MRRVLAVEAASGVCSVALQVGVDVIERSHDVPREHARYLLPHIDEVLAEAGCTLADLDALAVGRGPGSFTGVRAAIATVQGLAFGSGLPIVAASTLAVLAATARRRFQVRKALVMLDARMQEIYVAAYDGSAEVQAEALVPPAALTLPFVPGRGEGWIAVGSGLTYRLEFPELVAELIPEGGEEVVPMARDLAALAMDSLDGGQVLTDPATLQPVYLRDQVVHKSTKSA